MNYAQDKVLQRSLKSWKNRNNSRRPANELIFQHLNCPHQPCLRGNDGKHVFKEVLRYEDGWSRRKEERIS